MRAKRHAAIKCSLLINHANFAFFIRKNNIIIPIYCYDILYFGEYTHIKQVELKIFDEIPYIKKADVYMWDISERTPKRLCSGGRYGSQRPELATHSGLCRWLHIHGSVRLYAKRPKPYQD